MTIPSYGLEMDDGNGGSCVPIRGWLSDSLHTTATISTGSVKGKTFTDLDKELRMHMDGDLTQMSLTY
jgi:hypothetical protein